MTFPDQRISISFENAGMCAQFAGSLRKSLQGRKLSGGDQERVATINWLNTQLEANDSLLIDRFGRATLRRCAEVTESRMSANPKIGDGARPILVMIEMPPGAGRRPAKQ